MLIPFMMKSMAHILFLEPFYTGSHKYFADGLKKHSSHSIDLLTLPGRFWKWRMESGGLEFARLISEGFGTEHEVKKPDLILTGNLMDLAQFKAFSPWPELPHVLYVHENQLDYPLKQGERRDFHYGWKDYTNFLAADGLIFNSRYNLDSFLEKFKALSSRLPDSKPPDPSELFRAKSRIIPPGCRLLPPSVGMDRGEYLKKPPVILWNQRWEHDKNPDDFFSFLRDLKKDEIPFRLIVAGESFKDSPLCFSKAENEFKSEIIHMGFAESRPAYEELLRQSDIVVSTANQENFGISVIEAVSAGCVPLLPRRLAYPEVLPEKFHSLCLYGKKKEMVKKFIEIRNELEKGSRSITRELSESVQKYSWEGITPEFDSYFTAIGSGETAERPHG